MKLRSTILLLITGAIAGACSQNNLAQVEPDDMYFTRKDRQTAQSYYAASASTNSRQDYSYNQKEVNNYTQQHSPTLNSATLGSPTIQANQANQNNEVFYGATTNPDEVVLSEEGAGQEAGVNADYYQEDYGSSNEAKTYTSPQINNYYIYGNSARYRNPYPANGFFSMTFFLSNSFMSPWYNPFNPYYDPFYSGYGYYGSAYAPYWSYYDPFYTNFYYGSSYYGVCLNNNYNNTPVSTYTNYTNTNYAYRNGTRVIEGPRRSRSATPGAIKRQGTGNSPNDDGGRILVDGNSNRYRRRSVNTSDKSDNPVNAAWNNINRKRRNRTAQSETPDAKTIYSDKYRVSNHNQGTRSRNTVNNRTRTNSRPANSYKRNSGNNNRSHNSNNYNRTRTRSTYSPSHSNNSYRRSSSSPSRSSYSPSRSRSSYSPSRTRSAPRSGGSRPSGNTGRKRN